MTDIESPLYPTAPVVVSFDHSHGLSSHAGQRPLYSDVEADVELEAEQMQYDTMSIE